MADTSNQTSHSTHSNMPSLSDGLLRQPEDDTKNFDSFEEYSSGSDRSIEADTPDESRNDRHDLGEAPAKIRTKKRRHGSHGSRRHKGGSRHKPRLYQPYPDAGELENSLKRKSLELQEKENAAALLRQEGNEDQFITFPVAPFNSTQYLIEEHNADEPNSLSKYSSPKFVSQDPALSSLPSTPRNDTDDFGVLINLNKKDEEFSVIYSSIHAENLQSMPKDELVKHYMSLEEQVALLQRKVAEAEQRSNDSETPSKKDSNVNFHKERDAASGSDTNSLSSGNEEFVDISTIKAPMEKTA